MRSVVIPFFSTIFPEEKQKAVLSKLNIPEEKIVNPEEFYSKDYISNSEERYYLLVGTGGTENSIAEFIQHSKVDQPIQLLSYNLHNSLPAAMEIRTHLVQKGIETNLIHGKLPELAGYFQRMQKFDRVKERLRNSRIGLIGSSSEWLIASKIDEQKVKEIWGTKIITIPIEELLSVQNEPKLEELTRNGKIFIDGALNIDISAEKVIDAVRVEKQLFLLSERYQLEALTIKCFDLVLKTNITSCLGVSILNDKGIVAGCEGDIPTTFTMLFIKLLLDQPAFMANVIDVNYEQNSVKLAHCTVPLSMVDTYSVTSHFETRKSVAIQGDFIVPQNVTILKIGSKNLSQWWVAKGTICAIEQEESACRTQVIVQLSLEYDVDYFLQKSIANHHCVILGDHVEKIQQFFTFIFGDYH
jgi:L-fucose isomerase-like protein